MSALAAMGLLGGPPPDPTQMPVPGLREDLHVQRVGSFRDGSPRYRIHDALRNRYFELGLFDVEILAQWREGDTPVEIAQRAGEQLGLEIEPEEVLTLREFLVRHQLVNATAGPSFMVLREMWRRSRPHCRAAHGSPRGRCSTPAVTSSCRSAQTTER